LLEVFGARFGECGGCADDFCVLDFWWQRFAEVAFKAAVSAAACVVDAGGAELESPLHG